MLVMEALYDQEGTLSLSIYDPDEQIERHLQWGHGDLFDPDKEILQASSNFHFFSKYQIYCNRRNALSLFKARETTGRLILGGNSYGIHHYIKVSSKECNKIITWRW